MGFVETQGHFKEFEGYKPEFLTVRVSRIDRLLRSFVLFKFIDVDTCLQLIMYLFPMEVHLQLSADGYNIDPAKLGG